MFIDKCVHQDDSSRKPAAVQVKTRRSDEEMVFQEEMRSVLRRVLQTDTGNEEDIWSPQNNTMDWLWKRDNKGECQKLNMAEVLEKTVQQ
ncbi:hypothetical protein AMECASPLE_016815 [Ameca splendens]|uniref:Uncharacterized protein n=1 Tax=Ameca splendens TaxID=208324 RepID=A0ABV0XRA1_9TELE